MFLLHEGHKNQKGIHPILVTMREETEDRKDVTAGNGVAGSSSRTMTGVDLDKLGTSLNSMRDLIFVDDDEDDPMNCWSSMTGSDDQASDEQTDSFVSNVSFNDFDDDEIECPFLPTSLPYAQLVYDPGRKSLIALLEVSLAVHSCNEDEDRSAPKRLRMLERNPDGHKRDKGYGSDGSAANTTKSIRSDEDSLTIAPFAAFEDLPVTLLTLKATSKFRRRDPIVFATDMHPDAWLEEALDLYLLHDSQLPEEDSDRSSTSCTDALRKLLLASRSMVVFRSRMGGSDTCRDWHKVSRGPFLGMRYSCLLEI